MIDDLPLPDLLPEGCTVDLEDFGDGPRMAFRTPGGHLAMVMDPRSYCAVLDRCDPERGKKVRAALEKAGIL